MRLLTGLAFVLSATAVFAAEPLPIFDAHVHYSHDAWESVPPKMAIEFLRKAGVRHALVSSSNDDGNQKLLAADLPVPRRMIELARRHGLVLHSHSDADAIEREFGQWPGARILWAHAGFDAPARIREMLRKYPTLWCDLAFRTDHAPNGALDSEWRALFLEFPDRFLLGTDTFTPERWPYIVENARFSRAWLAQLPAPVAERIAWRNGERLFNLQKGAP
jgi:Amidohydrolase